MDHGDFTCIVSRAGRDASPYVMWSPLVLFLVPILIAIGLSAWFVSPVFFVLLLAIVWIFRGALAAVFASDRRVMHDADVVVSGKGVGLVTPDERIWLPAHEIAGIEEGNNRWIVRTRGGTVVGIPRARVRDEEMELVRGALGAGHSAEE